MILFINACARENSRTYELSKTLLLRFNDSIIEIDLFNENLATLDRDTLNKRTAFCNSNDFSNSMFNYAKDFAKADTIVIAAPYWDLSFPAILKKYIENICVCGITFKYSAEGIPIGLCNAKNLYYVTTCGGKLIDDSFGFGYIESLSKNMFGIKNCTCFKCENLDIFGNNPNELLNHAKQEILEVKI